MIRLPDVPLPGRAQAQLKRYQGEIDHIPMYADRVQQAKKKFSQCNRRENRTFSVVRETLTKMCAGARRCGYCEDSAADEVEHIKPKDLYPEVAFVWDNYLYACGRCNVKKTNHYAVFSHATGQLTDVTRKAGHPIIPPAGGEPILINPRTEDPLHFLTLDLQDTFFFLPRPGLDTRDLKRAQYTIEMLGLNDRDMLPAARAEAYGSYRARLNEYIDWRDAGKPQSELDQLVAAMQKMQHPTVWLEMKRQSHQIGELTPLFSAVPDALNW